MGATAYLEVKLLQLLFKNLAFDNIGDAGGLLPSVSTGYFYIALFTSENDDSQSIITADEATYTGYARIAVARNTGSWFDDDAVVPTRIYNVQDITFPECTAGSDVVTHWGLCYSDTGDTLLISGELTTPLNITAGVQPRIAAEDLVITLD